MFKLCLRKGLSNSFIHYKFYFFLFSLLFIESAARGQTDKEIWLKKYGEMAIFHNDIIPEIQKHGGPDMFGYFFIDSQDSARNAPVYRWANIAAIADTIDITEDDQVRGPLSLGFNLIYYGQIYNSIWVSSNGYLTIGYYDPVFLNSPIPDLQNPNNMLAVFWDDLHPQSAGRVFHYTNRNDSCVVTWQNFERYSGEGRYTFQAVIFRSGRIIFQYQMTTGVMDSYTVGIENDEGFSGLEYNYNNQQNLSGRAVYFGQNPPRFVNHDVLPSAILSPLLKFSVADSIFPRVKFANAGIYSENFIGRVTIYGEEEIYNNSIQINGLAPSTQTEIIYPAFSVEEMGDYEIMAVTQLPADMNRGNDTLRFSLSAVNVVFNSDFEFDSGDFTGNGDWQIGIVDTILTPHSGIRAWGTNINGNYSVGPLLSSLITDTMTIQSEGELAFWHWYNIESVFDGGNVKISSDDGASWQILTPNYGYDGLIAEAFGNPLGNQPAFYGISNGWLYESFNLSAFAGETVKFKFDFGSDNSNTAPGWYIDDVMVSYAGLYSPGWFSGRILDSTTMFPIAGAIISNQVFTDSTDIDGRFEFELSPGLYTFDVTAQFHNFITIDSVLVMADDTLDGDYYMPSPVLEFDDTPIDTSLALGDSVGISRSLINVGTGDLEFNIALETGDSILLRSLLHPRKVYSNDRKIINGSFSAEMRAPEAYPTPNTILDFGDELFIFDPQAPSGDDGCLGVEFDGAYFWVTGRHPNDNLHKLHKFDREGNYIASYNQNTNSTWGWRDMAFDGAYLYASDEFELAVIDPATGTKVGQLPMPQAFPPPLRGLTYDQSSDHFWSANFNSDIIEFDRSGSIIRQFDNTKYIYGLAWDDVSPNGPYLWVFSQDGDPMTQVSQFDPDSGIYTGVTFYAVDHNGGLPDAAGGACFTTQWDPSKAILFCLVMGRSSYDDSFDKVQGYEISPYSGWLRVTPLSGVIASGDSLNLVIGIVMPDSLPEPGDDFNAFIRLNTNASAGLILPVRVNMITSADDPPSHPGHFALASNYPNPFNSSTLILFDIPELAEVTLEIFNLMGQLVETPLKQKMQPGRYSLNYQADRIASGVYFYRLTAGSFQSIHKMTLTKIASQFD